MAIPFKSNVNNQVRRIVYAVDKRISANAELYKVSFNPDFHLNNEVMSDNTQISIHFLSYIYIYISFDFICWFINSYNTFTASMVCFIYDNSVQRLLLDILYNSWSEVIVLFDNFHTGFYIQSYLMDAMFKTLFIQIYRKKNIWSLKPEVHKFILVCAFGSDVTEWWRHKMCKHQIY